MNLSKCSFQNMLTSVLSVANVEQNFGYPPYIYEAHYNIVSSLLISKCAERYPTDSIMVNILEPFVKFVKIPVTNGVINLQAYKEYRNLLGTPWFNLKPDGKPCGDEPQPVPKQFNANTFRTANLRGGCRLTPLVIVAADEFAYRTSSEYAYPTQKDPIGVMIDKYTIQVCPYDLPTASVLYVIQEPVYLVPYLMQPDDTYILTPPPIESDWLSNAFTPFFNAMVALYSAYVANPELTNFAQILKERDIL